MKISKPENIDFNSLSSIIFDWGGVITNIDFQATIKAFQILGHPGMQKYFGDKNGHDLFLRLEKGQVEPTEVFSKIAADFTRPVTLQSLNEAFCAMILDTPGERISILRNLRRKYKLFLLSNTNIIHTTYYRNYFREKMNFDFTDLFDKVYYSNVLGMRKPDQEIFRYVLKNSRLNPRETLFLDDTEANILAAGELDMQVFQITPTFSMERVFVGL